MTLEEVLGAELYNQVQAKIDEVNANEADVLKHVRYADLSEGGYVSRDKYTALETDKTSVQGQLTEAQGLIETLKKGTKTDETLQAKIGEYEGTVATLQAENERLRTESALKVALLDAGAKPTEMDYLLFKAGQNGEIKIGEDGKLKGQDELISGLKTTCTSQFVQEGQKKIQENKLGAGDDGREQDDPKTLAEALKQRYEEQTNQE